MPEALSSTRPVAREVLKILAGRPMRFGDLVIELGARGYEFPSHLAKLNLRFLRDRNLIRYVSTGSPHWRLTANGWATGAVERTT